MLEPGIRYQLNQNWHKYPKGLKLRLLAIIKYKKYSDVYGAIVEHPNGPSWKYANFDDFDIIKKSEDLNTESRISFIPPSFLSVIDNYDMIVYSLANKWTVKEIDTYNRIRCQINGC